MKVAKLTLRSLVSRLEAQASEMARLRAELLVQFKRIAQMQAELDTMPHARERRKTIRRLLQTPPSPNGSHRGRV